MADGRSALTSAAVAAAGVPPISTTLGLLARRSTVLRGVVGVLTYHRIVDAETRATPGIASATATSFARQIAELVRGFEVVPMAVLLEARDGGGVPDRSLAITFDDGYRDFAELAWPVLRRHGLPVTLFVATGYVGGVRGGFWWDRVHAAVLATRCDDAMLPGLGRTALGDPTQRLLVSRELISHLKALEHDEAMEAANSVVAELGPEPQTPPILDWQTLRQLASDGVTLAPHTATHPLLTRVPLTRAIDEVQRSIADLRRETGTSSPVFAYPSGAVSDSVAAALPQLGIRLALTTQRGINDLRRIDPMRLHRINVGTRSDAAFIRAQLVLHALKARA
jgi:peptidoglycan/xylan/chitin deacetylase (PgdA/CDA1 family)